WLKKPGDKIQRDDLFVLIGTDKVESELPCEFDGILKEILIPEQGTVEVGAAICILEVDEKDAPNVKVTVELGRKNAITESQVKKDIKAKSYSGSKSFLSPVVRKIATEAGLELNDLAKIQGSGENGRIQKKDILQFLRPSEMKSTPAGFKQQKLSLPLADGDTLNQLSRMQKLLADHLQQSFMEIPHVTTFAEVDVTDIVAYREAEKDKFQLKFGTKITYTHFFQFAIIQALKEFPLLNTWMNVDEWIHKKDINLGFAASLANGELIVP